MRRCALLPIIPFITLLIAACGVAPTPAGTSTPIPPTTTPLPAVTGTEPPATPTQARVAPTETPSNPVLRVWISDVLAPGGNLYPALASQLEEFQARQGNNSIPLDVRVKASDSALDFLCSTLAVAPAAAPSLVLLGYEDVLAAAQGRDDCPSPVYPLEERHLSASIWDDMFDVSRAMTASDEIHYGVPYVLDAIHVAYRPEAFDTEPLRLSDLLGTPATFLFPADSPTGVSDTILAQYIGAGGRLSDADGWAMLDVEPLRQILSFYEQAVAEGVVSPVLLQYDSPDDYLDELASDDTVMAQVSVGYYLAHFDEMAELAFTPVPTVNSNGATLVTGWAWVMVTTDERLQSQALALLSWLMRPENQGEVARQAGLAPSLQTAFTFWDEDDYGTFVEGLLEIGALPPATQAERDAAHQLQQAFRNVILGRATADEAASQAVEALDAIP